MVVENCDGDDADKNAHQLDLFRTEKEKRLILNVSRCRYAPNGLGICDVRMQNKRNYCRNESTTVGSFGFYVCLFLMTIYMNLRKPIKTAINANVMRCENG